MEKDNKLIFLNHASFAIEREEEILLIDPWFEGTAFYNGWALLDKETTNDVVINYLSKSKKSIFIWYSHEHSDHFSISFLKRLQQSDVKVRFIFQKTLDGRVVKFLRKEGFETLECTDGVSITLSSNFEITTWAHSGGDSFCLIKCDGVSIVNVNDCVINSVKRAKAIANKIYAKTSKISILFTQFGYANWVGNEIDSGDRKKAALEKIERIKIQHDILSPQVLIPFASFVYFCHEENFYLNDAQNSPEAIRNSESLSAIQQQIFFMKSWDVVNISPKNEIIAQVRPISETAEKHWNGLKSNITPGIESISKATQKEFEEAFSLYVRKMTTNFLFFPQLLELCGIIKPLRVFISDLQIFVVISYIKGITSCKNIGDWDLSISSDVFRFMLKNEYGFNTTYVSGRFRLNNIDSSTKLIKFFGPQEYFKNGYGIYHPYISTKALALLCAKLFKRFSGTI